MVLRTILRYLELNVSVLLDNSLSREFDSMSPWYSVPSAAKPFGITNLVSLLGPGNSVLSNYLYDKTTSPNEQDTVISKMKFKQVEM